MLHRVVPDGCADILFTRDSRGVSLEAIGPMTSYRDFPLLDGHWLVGVRFHPGMWADTLRVPADRILDQTVSLDHLCGASAKRLLDHLAGTNSPAESVRLFEAALPHIEAPDRLQRALQWIAERRGVVSIDEAAGHAGFSVRQFRRLCLERTGLSPKFLARILRFRHALSRVRQYPGQLAEFALDCGYYDQAHCIREFRELSGRTPSAYGDGRFFQSLEAR